MGTQLTFDHELTMRLEAMYRTRDAVDRRRIVMASLGLRAGERVLDIGTGFGFMAAEMADYVGEGGAVLGIDLSEPMLEIARGRCGELPWVTFRSGDALALPVADGTFDVAVSVQVYELVTDLTLALSEMYRVLRPGGRGVIVSTDWEAIAWQVSDRERMARILKAYTASREPALPRTLAGRLREIGFQVQEQRIIPQFNAVYEPQAYSYQLIPFIGTIVSGQNGITPEELEAWEADLCGMGERGEYFFSLNCYLHRVVKPG
uniref:Ubiquinone/menaquinone biosynthesis C-methylase UbiE n=1 Tax=Candidatus Kentrum sp. FW TaxID=2126338 RepID=A0A450ST97_9GAMM|nr:MAG: Ubiquinone/menaquinone biosynthesis C-methylase UbiE [Candidatus Kentron sp. FW]